LRFPTDLVLKRNPGRPGEKLPSCAIGEK